MAQHRESFVVTRAARLVLGVAIVVGLGATVIASPARFTPAMSPKATVLPVTFTPVSFKPLGEGPAISVSKAFGSHDEDCVTVTQVKGPDGRVYTSRGLVCAE